MTQIVTSGALNTAGLIVPDSIVQIIAPANRPIPGVSTSTVGLVGGATWGPMNTPTPVGSNDQQQSTFGPLTTATSDLGTATWLAFLQGAQAAVNVRVTDGSDTAAAATIQDGSLANALTLTGKYSGTLGNSIVATLGPGSAKSSSRLVLVASGLTPETFDNISAGISSCSITLPSTYTTVPTISFSAPQLAGGVQATGAVFLSVTGTPTVGAGGTGYVIGDFITLSNGVVVKVATVTSGAVATLQPINTAGCNAGVIASGSTPANPVTQVSTTGSGTNATINLVWGLGGVTMTNIGSGYTGATATISSGAGTVSCICSVWVSIANAVNNGQSGVRGPSNICIGTALAGVGTVVAGSTTLSGGNDGMANINSTTLIGVDTAPRKGMYALRGQGTAVFTLADLSDITKFSTMATFAASEGTFAIATTPQGDTVSNIATEMSTAGVDSAWFKCMFGDWIYWTDTVNAVTRLVSPASVAAGLRAAIGPQFSLLNWQVQGIVGTQKSSTGAAYSSADRQTLINARVDVIANPVPGGSYFGFISGNNSSSNPAINGENYTMLTNFLAKSIAAWAGGNIGGTNLQSVSQRRKARNALNNFMQSLSTANPPLIGTADGSQPWQVTLDATNNPIGQVQLGIEVATVKVVYLAVVRWFIVNLIGGQSVQVTVSQTAPSFGT